MPGVWLLWGLTLIATANGDPDSKNESDASPRPPSQKPRAVYMAHGIQIPTAPYPKRRDGLPERYPSRRAGAFRQPPPDAPINFGPMGYQGSLYPSRGAEHMFNYPKSRLVGSGYHGKIAPDQQFRPRQQFAPAGNPRFGLPAPTPLGPYSQRRPLPPPPPPPPPPQALAPLREFDPAEKSRAYDRYESVAWQPHDTWQGAQEPGRIVRPPSPDVLGDLVPQNMRVKPNQGKGQNEPDSEEVGYVDAPPPEQETEKNPEYSEEILRMSNNTSTQSSTRVFLWRPPTTIRLPELLGGEDAVMLGEEPSPDDHAVLSEEPSPADHAVLSEEQVPVPPKPRRRSGQPRGASYFSNPLLL